jgi:hypothetical protein
MIMMAEIGFWTVSVPVAQAAFYLAPTLQMLAGNLGPGDGVTPSRVVLCYGGDLIFGIRSGLLMVGTRVGYQWMTSLIQPPQDHSGGIGGSLLSVGPSIALNFSQVTVFLLFDPYVKYRPSQSLGVGQISEYTANTSYGAAFRFHVNREAPLMFGLELHLTSFQSMVSHGTSMPGSLSLLTAGVSVTPLFF